MDYRRGRSPQPARNCLVGQDLPGYAGPPDAPGMNFSDSPFMQ